MDGWMDDLINPESVILHVRGVKLLPSFPRLHCSMVCHVNRCAIMTGSQGNHAAGRFPGRFPGRVEALLIKQSDPKISILLY